jgi:uncharacterized protein
METHDPSRLELVDALRGFALMGLFLVHMVEMFELHWLDPQPDPAFAWTMTLFAGKSFALFALCFGLSFFIIMDRARGRGVDFAGRFAWRLLVLLAIGLVHGLVYRGEILQVLAPLGLLLLLFDRIRDNRILLLLALALFLQPMLIVRAFAALDGAAWALQAPFFTREPTLAIAAEGSFAQMIGANAVSGQLGKWSYYIDTGRVAQIVGLFLVGLVLGRIGFFARPGDFRRSRRVALGVAFLLSILLVWAKPALMAAVPQQPEAVRQSLDWTVSGWIALSVMTVYVALFVEIFAGYGRPLLRRLAPVGRMTLTLYVGQSLVFVPIFYGFGLGLFRTVTAPQALAFGVLAFLLQIALTHLWFAHFHYGPLEWLWRAATYRRTDIPFRRQTLAPETA